jgi:peptidoglycan L-alanyl-D-glutamate endopeptidase CwlK
MAKLELLRPKVKTLANQLIAQCTGAGIQIAVTQTLRTLEEQDKLYAQGRTKPGNIVTNAKGGFSFHNFGVAFDVCPLLKGNPDWNNTELFNRIGKTGIFLGLEWGGNWTKFPDLPHLQYTGGYTLSEFQKNLVDWSKFDDSNGNTTNPATKKLKVSEPMGLNVRSGAGTSFPVVSKLTIGTEVKATEVRDGWSKVEYDNKGNLGWVKSEYLS